MAKKLYQLKPNIVERVVTFADGTTGKQTTSHPVHLHHDGKQYASKGWKNPEGKVVPYPDAVELDDEEAAALGNMVELKTGSAK